MWRLRARLCGPRRLTGRGLSHVAAPSSVRVAVPPDVLGAPRGVASRPPPLKVGELHHGFRVEAIRAVDEYNMTGFQLRHEHTGASCFHFHRVDMDNVFMLGFRTPPFTNSGVAHILEHTALCGSQRFPVRDPFFHMVKRSLKTHMNAYTYPDYTLYPFSTQNPTDFYNLLNVYVDAAFFPLLKELDFLQEGHRLEFEKSDDPTSRLAIKGVVYNEMKGALADSGSLFHTRLMEAMFPSPSVTYHYCSGGLPRDIPALTYQELRHI